MSKSRGLSHCFPHVLYPLVLKTVSLGEPGQVSLVRQHASDVFREGLTAVDGGHCPARALVAAVALICFDPNPGDTRGEAELVGRHAKNYRWESVVLLTTRAHGTRARIVVGQCFSGWIYVGTGSLPLGNWPYQIACERGALFKALVLYRSC